MYKKIISLFFITTLLASCISISVDSETQETPQTDFVTATLAPTKSGFVPATPTPAPLITNTATIAITAPPNCKNSAVMLRDVTIPDNTQVKAGESFTKTWEFQNNGTCPWVNYTLVFAAGDQMNAPLSAPIPVTVANEKVQISVQLTAPSSNGTYTGYFTLNDANGMNIDIGIEKTFWVKIVVGSGGGVSPTSAAGATQTGGTSGGSTNCISSQNASYVSQIAAMINTERTNAGLPALTINSQLTNAAQGHAADMACNNMVSHTGSDGSSVYSRISAAGYSAFHVEEIIYGSGSPQVAVTWWMSDQLHRDAILNPTSTEFGVGHAYYPSSSYGDYFVVDFGSP